MQCPRCDKPLTSGTYEESEAHHCAECGGTLFVLAALGRTLERLSGDLFALIDPAVPIPALPDLPGDSKCPQCKDEMENYGYMGTRQVMLDSCAACNFIWVDAMELATMAQMRARLSRNMQSFRDAHRPSDIVETHVNIRMVDQAFGAGFIVGGMSAADRAE